MSSNDIIKSRDMKTIARFVLEFVEHLVPYSAIPFLMRKGVETAIERNHLNSVRYRGRIESKDWMRREDGTYVHPLGVNWNDPIYIEYTTDRPVHLQVTRFDRGPWMAVVKEPVSMDLNVTRQFPGIV